MTPDAVHADQKNPGSAHRATLNPPRAGRIPQPCDKPEVCGLYKERVAEMQTPLRKDLETPLRGVRSYIVLYIGAFRVLVMQDSATSMGDHFL
jgi:hypothetical protein